jgi:ribosomal protein S18 acetylase RimI-like enzyme
MKYSNCTPSHRHTKNKKCRSLAWLWPQTCRNRASRKPSMETPYRRPNCLCMGHNFQWSRNLEERDQDAAIYIHRIATNPDFRGHNFVGILVEWAKEYARSIEKDFVRLDTLGNIKLIEHYTNAGFDFLGYSIYNPQRDCLHTIKRPKVVVCLKSN